MGSLRAREFARLDEAGEVYLDYTGAAVAPASLIETMHALSAGRVPGNPHAAHRASRRSTTLIEDAREALLAFFQTDSRTHAVCLTANATAAIKLVAESFPFGRDRGLLLTADNHNSINGIREFARREGAPIASVPLDDELRLRDPVACLGQAPDRGGLFAFPAQSNFSGVRHPLSLVSEARTRGWRVLLDAASFVPSHPLDLSTCDADFVVLSVYKMCGAPTGVGALIARHDAMAGLQRPWFAGGTVEFASVQNDVHALRSAPHGWEDGTPNYLGLAAVRAALEFMNDVGMAHVDAQVEAMTDRLLGQLSVLRHANGRPIVEAYGPRTANARGGTVAFNLVDASGCARPYAPIEESLSDAGIFVRGGCFCNPGAAEAAFHFDPNAAARCLSTLRDTFSIPRLAECLGSTTPVGALRASVGLATTGRDIDRLIDGLSALEVQPEGHPDEVRRQMRRAIPATSDRPAILEGS